MMIVIRHDPMFFRHHIIPDTDTALKENSTEMVMVTMVQSQMLTPLMPVLGAKERPTDR